MVGGHTHDRAELSRKELGLRERQANAAHAEKRVVLLGLGQVAQRLVGTRVERAHDQGAPGERRSDGA